MSRFVVDPLSRMGCLASLAALFGGTLLGIMAVLLLLRLLGWLP